MKKLSQMSKICFALAIALAANVFSYAYDFKVGDLCYTPAYAYLPSNLEIPSEVVYLENIYASNPKTFVSGGLYYNIINDTIAPFEVEITYTWGAVSSFNTKNYTELTTLDIPSTVEYQGVVYNVTRVGKQAFYGAQKLQQVTMCESIKTIDRYAFMNCPQLKEVQIGENVDSILLDAFGFGKLQQLSIPKNVKYIAPLIVRKNPITSINVHPENSNYTSIDGVLFNKNENILHTFPAAYATRYTIPESVDTIGSCAFAGTSIESVIFPKNLVCIANEAFIGTKLTELILPASLQSIGMYAFDMCTSLMKVICHATTPPIMSDGESEYKYHVFLRVPVSEIPLYVPAESIDAYKEANQWKEFGQILPIESTGVDYVEQPSSVKVQKLLQNGQVLILRDGKTYNVMGIEVR